MPELDRDALLDFLRKHEASSRATLVKAIYVGLRDRVTRGDFDRQEQ